MRVLTITVLLLVATIVVSVACVLLIIFMVANDRYSDQPRWFRRVRSLGGALWLGLFAIFFGCYWASVARDAARRGTVITSPDIGWMAPTHGYAAAALVVLMGLYSIFLMVRERRATNSGATRMKTPCAILAFCFAAGLTPRFTADARPYSHAEVEAMFVRIISPTYSYVAHGRRQQGSGLFRLHVNERGTVTTVTILKSTGHRALDSEAIETFMRWVAHRGERREVDVPVTFSLSGFRNNKAPEAPGKMDGMNLLGK